MTSSFSFDVFLSYNSQDKKQVQRLAERLRAAGVHVWFDDWIIQAGDDIYLTTERGLQNSRVLVLCLSPEALKSNWVSLERSTVLFRDPSNADRRFIPVLLTDCDLPDTLRRYRHVDFRTEDRVAFEELLTATRSVEVLPAKDKKKPKRLKKRKKVDPWVVLDKKIKTELDFVHDLAIDSNSKWLVASQLGNDLWIVDVLSGKQVDILSGHQDRAMAVCISSDGKRIISGSNDHTLRVWDAVSHTHLSTLEGHQGAIRRVAALSNINRVLSLSGDRTLRLWDISTGHCLEIIQGSDSDIFAVAVAPDDNHAVSGEYDGNIRLWSLDSGECLSVLKGHSATVRSVKITADGRYAVSGSSDTTCKIWKMETGACIGTLEGHKSEVHSVAISPDGNLIASAGSNDFTVRLWDFDNGNCVWVIKNEEKDVYFAPVSVAFTPDGKRLVVGTTGGELYIYRLTKTKVTPPAELTRRYMNAKVVIVGESGVGKSALALRLIKDGFVQTDSTHGMNVWWLDLPLKSQHQLEREALLWDLAGQEDYRLIHRLFLDETALALVLFNPQAPDPFGEASAWLKVLRSVAPKDQAYVMSKLLIAARVDVGGAKVSQRKIDRFLKQHDIAAYLPTSAKRGDNCSDQQNAGQPSILKQLIADHIPWDKLPWTSTPHLLANLKTAVTAMTEQKDSRLLRFAELAQRLARALPKEKFGEAEVRTAITLLANQGVVMPLKFGDLVLLRPELLNGYASAVIRAARDHTDEIGCVQEQMVYDRTIDLDGVDRLESADEELLMRAIVQTFLDKSLCIAEDTLGGRHLIFPSQYRREREIPAHPEIFVSYTFTGEWQTVYTTLVVRLWYSREFRRRELWRNAAEFETSKGNSIGLLMERMDEGVGTISIFFDVDVPDELKVVFIEYVHHHLRKYAREVVRDRRYVCPQCNKPVTDLPVVRERLEARKSFIHCQRCDEKVELVDHIEKQLASDPVAREVLGMDQKATQELDSQALEQILTGHMMAICAEANQIFRHLPNFGYGIDGEVEFKRNDGSASGKIIYVQLKNESSYWHTLTSDGREIFDVKNASHLEYYVSQPVDVFLVIRSADSSICWMNLTHYLEARRNEWVRQIVFEGEKLDSPAIWRVRDRLIGKSGDRLVDKNR